MQSPPSLEPIRQRARVHATRIDSGRFRQQLTDGSGVVNPPLPLEYFARSGHSAGFFVGRRLALGALIELAPIFLSRSLEHGWRDIEESHLSSQSALTSPKSEC
jgi:hypothetical protein